FQGVTHTSSRSSSSSDSEVDSCSKSCVTTYATLKEQYDSLSSDYRKSQFNLVSYKAGLESVKTRLAHYKKNEVVFEESINVLKLKVKLRDTALVKNKKKLEKVEKKRDELKLTLEKFQNSSKSLNNLLESQVIDKFKTGLGYNAASSTSASPAVESFVNSSKMLDYQENNKSKSDKGYHAVPLLFTRNFMPRKPDLMFMDEIVKIEPKTIRENSFRPPVIEDWNSDDDSEVEFIPNIQDKTVRPILTKSGKINIAGGASVNTAGARINIAVRPVNTAGSKPTVNHPRSILSDQVKDTTARDRTVVSKNKGIRANAVKASACWGNPQQKEHKEKGVIDSGCSRHMTGNKFHLTECEDY
ncbi:hypothetical protein Tco_1149504, partial [Tanacetum coccineum]